MPAANLLSTAQAAAWLGVTPRRVQALIAEGRLPAVRLGRSWIITPEDLNRLVILPVGWPKGRQRPKG